MEIAAGNEGMNESVVRRLKKLEGSRNGKKGSITKRINQLENFVSERNGRRATQLLVGALETVYRELEQVCEEISYLDEDDDFDIEDILFEVQTCVAMVTQYLEARKDDVASDSSSVALSWVRKHLGQFGEDREETGSRSSGDNVSVPEDDPEAQAKKDLLQNPSRYTYSDSRPATPRTLPTVPVSSSHVVSLGTDIIPVSSSKTIPVDVDFRDAPLFANQGSALGTAEVRETEGELSEDAASLEKVLVKCDQFSDREALDIRQREESVQYEWDSEFLGAAEPSWNKTGMADGLASLQQRLVKTASDALKSKLLDSKDPWERGVLGKTENTFLSKGGGLTFPLSTSFSGDHDSRMKTVATSSKATGNLSDPGVITATSIMSPSVENFTFSVPCPNNYAVIGGDSSRRRRRIMPLFKLPRRTDQRGKNRDPR